MRVLRVIVAVLIAMSAYADSLENGGPWIDTDGLRINCHGGAMLKVDSVYYWYGEHRPGLDSDRQKGVSCYSSADMVNWHNEGIVFSLADDKIERPKVVYNRNTGKYVMWLHHELNGKGYEAACSAVAVSDSPSGPFELVHSGRVNPGKYPLDFSAEKMQRYADCKELEWWTPEWRAAVADGLFLKRDFEGGQMARDMTIFVDEDGSAYHIYSSEENLTLHIAELSPDYTAHSGRYIRIFPGGHNEAPVMFKHGGRYWLICSGCTGWTPNEARMFSANNIFGVWQAHPNPCVGSGAETTFDSQGAFYMSVGENDFFVADQWRPDCLADSRTIILPIRYTADGLPTVCKE